MINNNLEKIEAKTTNNFITKYGLINKKMPEVIHIDMKGKVIPTIKKNNYYNDVRPIKVQIKNFIKETIDKSGLFKKEMIYEFELSDNSVTYLRDTNVKYSLFIKPLVIKPIKEYHHELSIITTKINDYISSNLKNIGFESK